MQNKKLKKILFFIEATGGGAAKHVADLISGIDKSLYQIMLVYSNDRIDDNFSNFIKENEDKILTKVTTLSRNANPFKDIKVLSFFYKVIKDLSLDIIHLHAAKAGLFGKFP